MPYAESILDLVGNTPLVRLRRLERTEGIEATLLAKLEYANPGGSTKDRIAVAMVEAAEREGRLKPGDTLVEPTSGNTGIGLAMVARLRGYKLVCVMNDKQSEEKRSLLRALGAEIVICPTNVPSSDPQSYISTARRIAQERGAFHPDQYNNPMNPEAHYRTTGPELWQQTAGGIDAFIAGMGTCGTVTGTARYLKERNPAIKVIGAEPEGSILRSVFMTGKPCESRPYKTEGIGIDYLPANLDFKVLDEIVTVSDKDAFLTARRLAREEGIFAGGSSGAAVWAALRHARQLRGGQTAVVLLPDSGYRYLSKVYNDNWMRENGYIERTLADLLASKERTTPQLISLQPGASALDALALMQQHEISHIPVFESGAPVGSIHEDSVLRLFQEGKALMEVAVRDAMERPLPVLLATAGLEQVLAAITRETPAVLVDLGHGRYDIVTKYDLIRHAARPA